MDKNTEKILSRLIGRVRKVRSWLLALMLLKISAVWLVSMSLYIGIYVWMDHQVNFGLAGRMIAFLILLASSGMLLYFLIKYLLFDISLSAAANHIENEHSFKQQLVTAVEYHQTKENYPYSKSMAEHLVVRVEKDCDGFKFDSTVDKRPAYVCSTVILLCICIVSFYVNDNFQFFSRYFHRLVQPLSAVAPIPKTKLISITEDITAKVNDKVDFKAALEGKQPVLTTLELTKKNENESEDQQVNEEYEYFDTVELQIKTEEDGRQILEADRMFADRGDYRYRFQADRASTPWHSVKVNAIPEIKSIKAEITHPDWLNPDQKERTYIEEITDFALEVLPDSKVKLTIESTVDLQKAEMTTPDGSKVSMQKSKENEFTTSFKAQKDDSMKFDLLSKEGVSSDDLPQLQVMKKPDKHPRFRLISPDSDYLATNVASVPVTFEVSDDFGIESISMHIEIMGDAPKEFELKCEKGDRKVTATHTIELENYDLTMGDGMVYYITAKDIDTDLSSSKAASSSEVYFIEIRPYEQWWTMESSNPGVPIPPPVELLEILENTRAILKKTWALANKTELSDTDRTKMDNIKKDLKYCAEKLVLQRDDPENAFGEAEKAVLNNVLAKYKDAIELLKDHNASTALPSEKRAYTIPRKFIIEIEKKLKKPEGKSANVKKPEAVKLQVQVDPDEPEKEKVANELEQLTQKLEKLSKDQKKLKKDIEKLMYQQQNSKSESSSSQSKSQSTSQSSSSQSESSSSSQSNSQSKSPGTSQSNSPGKGQAKKPSGKQSTNQSNNPGGKPSPNGSPAPGNKNAASGQERLKMVQAMQKAIRDRLSSIKQKLEALPSISKDPQDPTRTEVKKNMDEAIEQINTVQNKLFEARNQTPTSQGKPGKMMDTLNQIEDKLLTANDKLDSEISEDQAMALAKKAQKLAEEIAELSKELDKSLSGPQRQKMLQRLEAAKQLLASMQEAQWSKVSSGGTGSNSSHVLTQNAKTASAKEAQAIANEFWSIAIKAKKRHSQIVERQPSSMEYYELESDFFENAADFNPEQVER